MSLVSLLRFRSREFAVASLAAAAAVCVYLGIAWVHGALGASRNDDWVYYRAVLNFARDGYFHPDAFTDTMLVGQVLLFQPALAIFGYNLAVFQILICSMSGVGLLACYAFLRRFLAPAPAILSVGALALSPIFATISTSFMTDAPSFTLQALCLLLGARAMSEQRLPSAYLAASLAVGLLAFSFREYAAAAPMAVSLVSLVKTRSAPWKTRLAVMALSATWLALAIALYVWRKSFDANDGQSIAIDIQPREAGRRLFQLWFSTCFLIAPFLAAIPPRTVIAAWSRHKLLATAAAALSSSVWVYLLGHYGLLLGNYLQPYASYSETMGGVPPRVFPEFVWLLIECVSGLSSIVLAILAVYALGMAVRRFPLDRLTRGSNRSAAALALVYVGLVIGVLCVAHALGLAPLFDRYLVPVIPFATGWLIYAFSPSRRSRPQRIGYVAALGAYAVVGLAAVDASATFDGAKWQTAKAVAEKGYPAQMIDGGYEWFGLNQPAEIRANTDARGRWWTGLFKDPVVCVVISLPDKDGKYSGAGDGTLVASRVARGLFGTTYSLQGHRVSPVCNPAHKNPGRPSPSEPGAVTPT